MENLFLRGRYLKTTENIQFFNVGSGISLYFQGSSITFYLESVPKSGYIYVIEDFNYFNKQKYLIKDVLTLTLYFNDNKPHYIDLVKANESMDNSLIIKDIKFTGKILNYREKPAKFIKVYGDSTIAGYGILAHEGNPDISTNDGVEDFCFRALYNLKYDFDLFAASGWGLTFSAYTNPKEVGIENFIQNLCVCSNAKWNSKKADLLIISLGTNDNSYIEENSAQKDELKNRFIDACTALIVKERANNPTLPVLMIYGSLKEENVYPLIKETYEKVNNKLGNIHLLKLPGDNSGQSNHSYVSYHEQMAQKLEEKIVKILS